MGSFVFANGVCSAQTDARRRSRRGTLAAIGPLLILGKVLQLFDISLPYVSSSHTFRKPPAQCCEDRIRGSLRLALPA